MLARDHEGRTDSFGARPSAAAAADVAGRLVSLTCFRFLHNRRIVRTMVLYYSITEGTSSCYKKIGLQEN